METGDFSGEELFDAACSITASKGCDISLFSQARSRATKISYVLAAEDAITVTRIPIQEVQARAKLKRLVTHSDPPCSALLAEPKSPPKPEREGLIQKVARENFEGAVFYANLNGLLRPDCVPSNEHSGEEGGFFSRSYHLRDASGQLICIVDSFDIATANQEISRQRKFRAAKSSKDWAELAKIIQWMPRGRLEFHGGFYTGKACSTGWNTIVICTPPFEEIDFNDISKVEQIDSRNEKNMAGSIGASVLAGTTLGLLSGGLGLIGAGAGLIAGGSENKVTYLLVLKDGRQALVTSAPEAYSRMLGRTFESFKPSQQLEKAGDE